MLGLPMFALTDIQGNYYQRIKFIFIDLFSGKER